MRLLHGLMKDLRPTPDALDAYVVYVELLRSMRERLHPIGVAEHRMVETEAGPRLRVNLGERLGSDFFYGYDAERTDAQLFTALVDPGDVVVDAGANFGYYTVLTGAATGPAGAVHAFEPDPEAFKLLMENVALNALANVTLHDVCLGADDAEVDFHLMEESAFSGLSPTGRARSRGTMRTTMRRLDSVLAEQGAPTVTRMKIDVEGHEYAVLAGARETIRRSRDVLILMIEVSAKNLTPERRALLDAELQPLAAEGFRGWVVAVDDGGRHRLCEVADVAGVPGANVVLAREGSPAHARLQAAIRHLDATRRHDDGGALLRRLRDREAALAALAAEHRDAVRDHDARIATLTAELEAARAELRALAQRWETRIGARLRRLTSTALD